MKCTKFWRQQHSIFFFQYSKNNTKLKYIFSFIYSIFQIQYSSEQRNCARQHDANDRQQPCIQYDKSKEKQFSQSSYNKLSSLWYATRTFSFRWEINVCTIDPIIQKIFFFASCQPPSSSYLITGLGDVSLLFLAALLHRFS